MAEESEDQEKTEPATPRRLQKARDEGQVARSRELTTFLLLLAGVVGLWSMGQTLYNQMGLLMEQSFLFERRRAFETGPMLTHVGRLVEEIVFAVLPLFLLLASVALIAPNLLGGFLASAKGMKPQLSKLNPLKGLKRMFGTQALVELAKVIAKALLVGIVSILFLYTYIGEFMNLMNLPVQQALARALMLVAIACGVMVLGLILVVLIDVPYQLWHHAKKLRMSKQEIKREHKESEGDPHVKARIRSQQQAMARRRMMSKVPEADVIVTNPTHYAVALSYREAGMAAPIVVAKGADAVALKIREIGSEHNVPTLAAPLLARVLHQHVDLEREVPAELYTAVAEVLAWAFNLKRARAEGTDPAPPPTELDVPGHLDPHAHAQGAG